MSSPSNPYRAPQSAVDEAEGETQPVRLLTVSGRIGRLRYICYGVLVYLVLALVAGVFAAVAAPAGAFIVGAAWLAMLVIGFMLTIQRCHDFNTTGWLSILMLVPLVNLIFWFIPGTEGQNRYGAPTPPNSTGVIIGAIAVPIVVVAGVGMLAAVAVPARDEYTNRARVSEVVLNGSPWRDAVAEHYRETRKLPSSSTELRKELVPAAGDSRYGMATLGENGVITLTMSREAGTAADKTILLRPTVAGNTLNWDCTGGTLQAKYRPRTCRAQ